MINLGIAILAGIIIIALFFVIFALLKRFRKKPSEKSTIEILPEKTESYAGDRIDGKVILNLKEPIKSKKLVVGLKCENVEEVSSSNSKNSKNSKKGKHVESNTLFEVSQTLEEEKNYVNEGKYSYDFSIIVPEEFSELSEDSAGALSKSRNFISHEGLPHVWYLYVTLECADADITQKLQIKVH